MTNLTKDGFRQSAPERRGESAEMMEKFTLYWLTGSREVVEGRDISDAFMRAGYGGGALRALDFYSSGENEEYEWDKQERRWNAKPGSKTWRELEEAKARRSL